MQLDGTDRLTLTQLLRIARQCVERPVCTCMRGHPYPPGRATAATK